MLLSIVLITCLTTISWSSGLKSDTLRLPLIIEGTDQSKLFPENVSEIVKLIEEDSIKMDAVLQGLLELDTLYVKTLESYLLARQQSRDLQVIVDNLTTVLGEYEIKFDTLKSRMYGLEDNTRDAEDDTTKEVERLTRSAKLWKAVGIGSLGAGAGIAAYLGIKGLIKVLN